MYAFAIVLHEVYGRQGTWGESLLEPMDILERVKFAKENGRYMRPDISAVSTAPGLIKSE